MTWKITACAPRRTVEAALAAHEAAPQWNAEMVVAGSEMAEERPDEWLFEAWLPQEPGTGDLAQIGALFADGLPEFTIEHLPETDWVAESQAGLEPIVAGRFRVRTPVHPPADDPRIAELVIPASRAFGTGQHATTAGCLEMLTAMAERGIAVTSYADIGTGTGLLAFAARELWPQARGIASDIDPVCEGVVGENAVLNRVPLGAGPGELAVVVADGMDDPRLRAGAPYDLVVANILAAPLIALAEDLVAALARGGQLLLAGLLTSQEGQVLAAYERLDLALAERMQRGDWSILWLRK